MRGERVLLDCPALLVATALLAIPAPSQAIELTCGACRENCKIKYSKYAQNAQKRPYRYFELKHDCFYEECGACSNGESVKVPNSHNGKYNVRWYFQAPSNPGKPVRPLPQAWGTSGVPPIDIRLGDVYVDGNLVERVASEPTRSRGYFSDLPVDCEAMTSWHQCTIDVCKEYQRGLRECARLDDRILCDWENVYRMHLGGRHCRETGQTNLRPIPPEEYPAQGRIEVPEGPVYRQGGTE